jgi:aminoglycoside phosphotransferase family enzyme/predicted kinase
MSAAAGVAETHSAVVFFFGDHAYKVKKAVDLGFLDFRTRAQREEACHREVALNRRLAPDVYEGVADVLGPDGAPCDHLVVMRRMPDERRLSQLVVAGADVDDDLRRLAHLLAAFHGRATRSAEADGLASLAATRARWEAGTDALIADGGRTFQPGAVASAHALACRYLDGRRTLFDARIADGRAVDGHGDLLADDIFLLPDGPRVLDCLDFDERLRMGDALADAAFLAMDLERLGRPDLADRFLAHYAELSGDVWPPSLAHHHLAYRAHVRAKVTAIRADQGDRAARSEAQALLGLCLHHLEAGRVRLVLVGGEPGTGKSTLAAGLAESLEATLLQSDVVRKELHGVPALQSLAAPTDTGAYAPEVSARTYEELLRRAAIALSMGESVVLDASWADASRRAPARALAARCSADLIELRCAAPEAVADVRISARQGDASDATPAVAGHLRAVFAPWPEATEIDTSGSIEASLARAHGALHVDSARSCALIA